jgi:DNA-binding MarR family transcriptional regulator
MALQDRSKRTRPVEAADPARPDNGPNPSFLPKLISFHLRSLGVHLNRAYDRTFEGTPVGRGTGKLTTLFLVAANPGINQTEVARALGKDRAAMVRLIDHIEAEGLLERRPSPAGRHSYALVITEKARRQLAQFERMAKAYDVEFFAGLSARERKELRRIVIKLRRLHHFGTFGLED